MVKVKVREPSTVEQQAERLVYRRRDSYWGVAGIDHSVWRDRAYAVAAAKEHILGTSIKQAIDDGLDQPVPEHYGGW